MSKVSISISLGDVDFDSLMTDEDFEREADRLLPDTIVALGEATGVAAFDLLKSGLKDSPIKLTSSDSKKHAFVQNAGQKFASEVSNEKKVEIREAILRRLRERKAELGDSGTAD